MLLSHAPHSLTLMRQYSGARQALAVLRVHLSRLPACPSNLLGCDRIKSELDTPHDQLEAAQLMYVHAASDDRAVYAPVGHVGEAIQEAKESYEVARVCHTLYQLANVRARSRKAR